MPESFGIILALLDCQGTAGLNQPGLRMHPLKGDLKGQWSMWVNGNWRSPSALTGPTSNWSIDQDYH